MADSRQGVVLQVGGLSEVLNTPYREHRPRTKGIHVLGPGIILWHDLDLQEVGLEGVAYTGLICLRIGTDGGHLSMR